MDAKAQVWYITTMHARAKRAGFVLWVAAGAAVAGVAAAAGEGAFEAGGDRASSVVVTDAPPATAAERLRIALAVLPQEPIKIEGTLTVRRQRGQTIAEHPYTIRLDWGRPDPSAVYEIRDGFGRTQERLTVTRPGPRAVLKIETGDPLVAAPSPPTLAGRVSGTDLTWLDLTLDFLWWRDARIEGQESVRGRLCDIVVAQPPEPIPGCSAVRLWLDRQVGFLVQAEQLDPQGAPSRRMWVRSVKKIRERWIIRDMEIESLNSDHRTRLHVEDWVAQ
jgi:hypothetical protein